MRFSLLLLTALLFVTTGCDNKYPGTAQQSGALHLLWCGTQIATAIDSYHNQHGKWPSALSELTEAGTLTSHDLLYPGIYDLPDRRDILGFTDGIEWIYISPSDRRTGMPLLIAPLPYTSSMGRRLPRPKRIIVKPDRVAQSIEEDEVAKLIKNLTNA
jgi:hypothetical protein